MADVTQLQSRPTVGDLDRTPPQDLAAEQSVLGAMMMSKDAIAEVLEVLKGLDFYRPAHELIFDAILDLYGRGEPADAVTVADQLTKRGDLARAGGHIYLHDLLASVAVAANAEYYADIVKEKAVLRRLVEASIKIAQMGYQAQGDVADIVDAAQQTIYEVNEGKTSEDYKPLKMLIEPTIDEMEMIESRGGGLSGVPTGFAELDELTNGFHGGQMIIVAARPAVGKALAIDTRLPTPTGWTTMGEVHVGDQLLDAQGRPTTVVAATGVMVGRPCFRMSFNDGTTVIADAEHQWRARCSALALVGGAADRDAVTVTVTTAELAARTQGDAPVWSIEASPALVQARVERGATGLDRHTIMDVAAVSSVPVRCVQVDNAEHLYLATESMVPTHNSTLALDFARAASVKNRLTTAFFSLEMSQTEIVMRLLSAEAQVWLHSIRSGKMSDEDWRRVVNKTPQISEAPLFIDDSPNLTMMEIRAKARRLKQRHDLKMVIIDYMQLMTSGKKVESRQLEVSEFSRQIKLLAKELDLPVIALSQLNRGPEQRTDKKPMLSDLRESGCLTRDTRVLRADTGAPVTMGELLDTGARNVPVWSLDERHRLVAAPMTHVFSSGVKMTYRLTLAAGRQVKASGNHPFLTWSGWRPLDDLTVGDRVAIPRRAPEPTALRTMNDDDLLRLADPSASHVAADVFSAPTHQISTFLDALVSRAGGRLTTTSRRMANDVASLTLRLGVVLRITSCTVANETVYEIDSMDRSATDGTGDRAQLLGEAWNSPVSDDGLRPTSSVVLDRPATTADVYWDSVVSIEPLGEQEVFDATVLGTHNFIADGITVHNSLEQDADMVILLHRDDVYDKESRVGEADLIVAKHRNGPTKTVVTAFQGHYSRFVDMQH